MAESNFSGNRKRLRDTLQKGGDALFTGITKTYVKINDSSEDQPGDEKKLPTTVKKELSWFRPYFAEAMREAMIREATNQSAKADLTIFGRTFKNVPATSLLNMESKLQSLLDDVIDKIPTRSNTIDWVESDAEEGSFRTAEPKWSWRTEKRPYNHVKAPESAKHPAQVDVLYNDEKVGKWEMHTFTGAIHVETKAKLYDRCRQALAAVKAAREEANLVEIADVEGDAGEFIYDQIFDGVI